MSKVAPASSIAQINFFFFFFSLKALNTDPVHSRKETRQGGKNNPQNISEWQ